MNARAANQARTGRRVRCRIAASGLLAFALAAGAAQTLPRTGTTRSETVRAGQTRSYRVEVGRSEAATLTLQQTGAAALTIRWSADSQPERSLVTEAGRSAKVGLTLAADAPRVWTLSIEAAAGASAEYSLTLAIHAATPMDRRRSAATDALAAAEALRREGNKELADKARPLYESSARAFLDARDGCGARRAYVAWSGFEHDIVNPSRQQTAARAALDASCRGDIAEQALAERLLGSAYINQGDFASGTSETERAVALFGKTGDAYQRGVALRNLGLAYTESGEIGKGLATTNAALKAAEHVGDGKLLALVHNDLAFMYSARGEFARAIDAYRQTLDALRAHPFPMAEAVAWINLGVAYGQLGDGEQALSAFEKGRSAATAVDCWSCLAEIDVDRGDDLLDGGEVAKAEAAYRHALDIAKAHDLVRQRAEALRGLGRCAMAAKDWDRARALLDQAREDLHRTHGRVNESVVYAMLGDLENRQGRIEQARRDYEQSLALAREAANQAWQAVALASLARVAEESRRLDEAKRDIEQAIALIESERTRINAPDLRTSYFGTKRSYYGLYIEILMRLDRRDPRGGHAAAALIVAEHARARELQEQLAERAIRADQDVDPKLLAAESEAEDRLHALAYQLAQVPAGDAKRRTALQASIDDASRRLDDARGRIHAANPRYAELVHPTPLGLDEIQRTLLDGDVSVLEYWLGDTESYLWVVKRDALHAYVLPAHADIERAAAALRGELLQPSQPSPSLSIEQRAMRDASAMASARTRAADLSRMILPAPARASLRREVAIVADGELQALPFSLLDSTREHDRATDPAFVYLPSIGTLRGLRTLPPSTAARNAVAVVADPVFRADDRRLGGHAGHEESPDSVLLRAASEAGIADLPRLPHTREEAEVIQALADDDASWIALDFSANREAALKAAWARYGVVHFATHALLNARHPELSGIVLSLFGPDGRAEDGFLRINDIYGLHMPADLVVLSVCDSAVGTSVGAEGAANLARAFFYAGARHVVASLWPVDDRASVAFMRGFYRALLEENQSPQQALIAARRAMQANPRWSAPYYWAGYVLEGDWR